MAVGIAIGIGAKIGGRVIASMASERMLVWALRLLASRSDTMVDDFAVDLIEAALDNDTKGMQDAAKAISKAYFDERRAAK